MGIDFTRIPPQSWLLPCLEVCLSPIDGLGVFTNRPLRAGVIVVVWGGIVLSMDEFKVGKGLQHTNVGLDEGVYLASAPDSGLSIDDYMNHSCNPNLWLNDEITLVARRDIIVNEELTIDYAIELLDESYVMKKQCNCRATNCRKVITGRDWRLKEVQDAYRGHFSPFIERRINKLLEVEVRE